MLCMKNPFNNFECTEPARIFNRYWNNDLEINPVTIRNALDMMNKCQRNEGFLNLAPYSAVFSTFYTEYYKDNDTNGYPKQWSAYTDTNAIELLQRLCYEVFPKRIK